MKHTNTSPSLLATRCGLLDVLPLCGVGICRQVAQACISFIWSLGTLGKKKEKKKEKEKTKNKHSKKT